MKKELRFEIVFDESSSFGTAGMKILRDKETGVQYLFFQNGYAGGMTVLLDKDGKPAISE